MLKELDGERPRERGAFNRSRAATHSSYIHHGQRDTAAGRDAWLFLLSLTGKSRGLHSQQQGEYEFEATS